MIKSICKLAMIATFALASAGSAYAGASFSGASGSVLVNNGSGYQTVSGAGQLNEGDRIMVGPNASASVTFDKGCTVSLKAGQIVTIGSGNPCKVKALEGAGFGAGENVILYGMLGGALVLGGVIFLTDKNTPRSP